MEEMLLTYHEGEDGMFYPDLELPVEKVSMTELGRFAFRAAEYLKENHKDRYKTLVRLGMLGETMQAVDRALALLEALHRQVVVLNRSVPGFLVNRFAQALFRESIYLIEQGVTTAADIDRAVKYAVGMRYASIGLLEYFDAVGFGLEKAIAENVYPDLCGARDIQETVLRGLASGKTGQAAGEGLYDWSEKDGDDFRFRKQAPYFDGVRKWTMPG